MSCGLWGTLTCQCRFTIVTNVPSDGGGDSGEAVHMWGRGHVGNSLTSVQFCCKLKTALKNKVC